MFGCGIESATRKNICIMPLARATRPSGTWPPSSELNSMSRSTSVRRDRHQHLPACSALVQILMLWPTFVVRSSVSDMRSVSNTLSR